MQKAYVCVYACVCACTQAHVYLKADAALQSKWVTCNEVQQAFAFW